MKNKSIIIKIILIAMLIFAIMYANINKKQRKSNGSFRILTTFYPIYVMALNITDGAENVEMSNMTETSIGCIHDYTLKTEDLKKIENTDVLIQNGKGLESFFGKIKDSYPKMAIIESAQNIDNLIKDEHDENAHIWLSIENYISQVTTISKELQELNEKNKNIYEKNTNEYITRLTNLKSNFEKLNLTGKTAICLNEAIAYLLDEIGINAEIIETDHEHKALSAEELKRIIKKMNTENIKIIFIDKNDDRRTAESIANETGSQIYTLDSAMHGEDSKDSYIKAMEYNYRILEQI